MKWITRVFVIIAVLGFDAAALAKKGKGKGGKGSGGYGMAGCGLGAVVMGPKGNQILAATLNSTGYQTFALTSGTSNCAAKGSATAAEEAEREVFVAVNIEHLSRQAASGGGEHLYAFSEILGCNEAADGYDDFVSMSQTRFGALFASLDPEQVVKAYVSEISKTPRLASSCLRAS